MFQNFINGQYRRPSGLLGRWIGRNMAHQHLPENRWTVTLLQVQPTDHILEIGFGPGVAIQEVVKLATQGFVAGIDISCTMVGAASRRNAQAIRAGQVSLKQGDVAHLPFADQAFDKVFGIHTVYFWPQPLAALCEIYRVLKPRGMLVLTILPEEQGLVNNSQEMRGMRKFHPYTGDELARLTREAGFAQTRVEADTNPAARSNYSVIGSK